MGRIRRQPALAAAAIATVAAGLPGAAGSGVSGDGRFVAFASDSARLVVDDTNRVQDVFVRDLTAGTTERVSVASDGSQADGASSGAAMSGDGRVVAFTSAADNLVAHDTNGRPDVFVHHRVSRTTERISVGVGGIDANDDSFVLAVSSDGRVVVFASAASNLVVSLDTPGGWRYFARDRATGATERIDIAPGGTTTLGSVRRDVRAATSADGRYVAFVADTPGSEGLFVRDRLRRTTELVSSVVDKQRAVALSADGRLVAFTIGPSPTTVVVRDRVAGVSETVSVGIDGAAADGAGYDAALSGDGRFVAFQSDATNLLPGDTNGQTDVFVRDRTAHTTERVSVGRDGLQADGASFSPELSADGNVVSFGSLATNLVAGDDDARADVFVRDRARGVTTFVTEPAPPPASGRPILTPRVPRAGRLFTATLRVTDAGRTVLHAGVVCDATVAGRLLPAAAADFHRSAAHCAWRLPGTARGRLLRGTITATTTVGAATRRFALRIR